MTEEDWTEDEEWGEEEAAAPPPRPARRAVAGRRVGGRLRAFAFGATGGVLALVGLALLGGGGGGETERGLSPETAAAFQPLAWETGSTTPARRDDPASLALARDPALFAPARDPGFGRESAPGLEANLEMGGLPPRVAPGLPPPPAFVPPGDWSPGDRTGDRGWAPMELSAEPAPSSGGPEGAALFAPDAPAPPEAQTLDAALLPPPGGDAAPIADVSEFAEPAVPEAVAPAPPPAEPAAASAESAPLESPAPRPKPVKPEHAALDPSEAADPDVYSPPRPLLAEAAPASGSRPPRGGWGARLRLDDGKEKTLAAAAPPPVHDPGGILAAEAAPPIHDPEAAGAAGPPPMISAAGMVEPVEPMGFGAEFGPDLSPEAFAAMRLSDGMETGDLPRVRVAPIDSPEDGPFSARAEPPAASAARRRPVSGPALPPDAPRVTVVVTALGLHEAVTLRALRETPDAVALAFAPIGRRVGERVAGLRSAGRVALVEAPMEAMTRAATPDEITLVTGVAAEENQARLEKVLSAAPQASGISTYMGARFTADPEALAGVLPTLARRGLILLENQPTNRSLLRTEARRAGVGYAAAPVALDRERGAAAIRTALAQLERQALADGEAVGVMAVSNEALDALALWTEGLASRGLRLAPLGEAVE